MKKTVCVCGEGVVGSLMVGFYEHRGFKVVVYDPPKGKKLMLNADVYVICVPTPLGSDIAGSPCWLSDDAIIDCLSKIAKKKTRRVILRSTVDPLAIKHYEKLVRGEIVLWPEFLSEKTALFDFHHQHMDIVGSRTSELPEWFDQFHNKGVSVSTVRRQVTPEQAAMIKLAMNAYGAVKLIFFEQLFDLCEGLSIAYAPVSHAMKSHPWVGNSHTDIGRDGYRGFKGKCLPKDAAAFKTLLENCGLYPTLVGRTIEINKILQEHENLPSKPVRKTRRTR